MNAFLSQEVPLSWYLLLSAALFSLGVVGFLIKRNLITVFMSIELMLNGVNLSFVTFAHQWPRRRLRWVWPSSLPSSARAQPWPSTAST
jgi:multisubunit Na+/H+ antiporter MnhC subunit